MIAEALRLEEVNEMPNLQHGNIGGKVVKFLSNYVDENELGAVFTSQTTYKFVGDPPTRYPDLSFINIERLPEDLSVKADFAPDLAVEVMSESDNVLDVEKKIDQYQISGVRLVWIIYPYSKIVAVYRLATGLVPQIVSGEDELDGFEVVPGFKLKVSKIFELPKRKKI